MVMTAKKCSRSCVVEEYDRREKIFGGDRDKGVGMRRVDFIKKATKTKGILAGAD